MCDRAFKSTVIAFLQKDRMNFLAVGRPRVTSPDQPDVSTWFWFGHSNTTGSLTVICSVCYSQETVKLFICWCLETLMCQPAACQQLPSFASGDRQFTVRPIMHYVYPAVAFWGQPDQRLLHNYRCSLATSTIITSNASMEFESKLILYSSDYIIILIPENTAFLCLNYW